MDSEDEKIEEIINHNGDLRCQIELDCHKAAGQGKTWWEPSASKDRKEHKRKNKREEVTAKTREKARKIFW